MKKKIILILIFIIACIFYGYKSYIDQEKKNEKIICDCQKNGIITQMDLASFTLNPKKTLVFFNKVKINYTQNPYAKGFLISLQLSLNKSLKDTLFIGDEKKTIKIYNFDVDTLIVNKKRSIQCDLKHVSVDGKKQYVRDIIILD